ncbi:Gfo/Idh/MocA family oxidoreductase [soil metagenome]
MITRRSFAHTTAAGLAVAAAPGLLLGARADKPYKTALIGTGWWGTNILREAIGSGRCKVVGLCDVDENQLDTCASAIGGLTADQPKRYKDYRELLETEKPDICIVATADHWHPLITIDACKAGADVYVEKPIGHTVLEGKAMVKAAREHDRRVQVGTHRRVSPHNVSGMEFLKSGQAGKIGMVRAFVHYGGGPEQPSDNQEPPDGLDWEMWCGPAPLRPFNPKIHPKGFRNFLDYANGTLGDWGIHWMDQILMWTDEPAPRSIYSTGGRPIAGPAIHDGDRQTTDAPDHQLATFEFEGFSVSWEHRKFAGNNAEKTHPGQAVGCYFYGTEGTFHMGWLDGWTFYPANAKKAPIHVEAQLHEPDQQNIRELWADLLASIDDRENGGKRLPVCDIEIGHRSTNMSLLGMLSWKLGRSIAWDHDRHEIAGDPEANALLKREYRGPWQYPDHS